MNSVASSPKQQPRSLIAQVFWVLRKRPLHLLQAIRSYLMFLTAYALRPLCIHAGIKLAENVRLQKNSSLMAEKPAASIKIEAHSVLYENAKIEAYGIGSIEIGSGSIIGDIKIISRYRVSIGKRFLSSWNVFIQDYDPHPIDALQRKAQVENMLARFKPQFDCGFETENADQNWSFPGEPITIGDDVWVGANVTILKGAHIGDGSVIATGAVVLKGDYPARSVIAGNPAKVVKEIA